jgi:hypothetical protein
MRAEMPLNLELLVRPNRVAQHVTGGLRGYEFPTQFIQWGAIVVSNMI